MPEELDKTSLTLPSSIGGFKDESENRNFNSMFKVDESGKCKLIFSPDSIFALLKAWNRIVTPE